MVARSKRVNRWSGPRQAERAALSSRSPRALNLEGNYPTLDTVRTPLSIRGL